MKIISALFWAMCITLVSGCWEHIATEDVGYSREPHYRAWYDKPIEPESIYTPIDRPPAFIDDWYR